MAARKPKVTPNKAGRYELTNRTEMGMGAIATDVHSRAVVNAPKDTRALVNSSRIVKLSSGHWVVRFGNKRVRYARIHELGGTIKPKTANVLAWQDPKSSYANKEGWVFAKSVTIKAKHYLTNAGKSVFEGDIKKYFRF